MSWEMVLKRGLLLAWMISAFISAVALIGMGVYTCGQMWGGVGYFSGIVLFPVAAIGAPFLAAYEQPSYPGFAAWICWLITVSYTVFRLWQRQTRREENPAPPDDPVLR